MSLRRVLHNVARHLAHAWQHGMVAVMGLIQLLAVQPIYAQTRPLTINFSIVADTNTAIPNSSFGNFATFNPAFLAFPPTPVDPPSPCMSNGNVAFWGANASDQGTFANILGTLSTIADQTTFIPTGGGTICFLGDCPTFNSFSPTPALSGNNALLFAPTQGLFSLSPPSPLAPAATLNTLIPDGSGTFSDFGFSPALSGLNFAFVGDGVGLQGVYASYPSLPNPPPTPVRIADFTTVIPGGAFGTFDSFPVSVANPLFPPAPIVPPSPVSPAMSGLNVAFIGDGVTTTGIYVTVPPQPVAPPAHPPAPVRVVDSTMLMPGTTSAFNFFSGLSIDGTTLSFVGGVNNGTLQAEGVFVATLQPANSTFTFSTVATTSTLVPNGQYLHHRHGHGRSHEHAAERQLQQADLQLHTVGAQSRGQVSADEVGHATP
jgi:hypothetical protein